MHSATDDDATPLCQIPCAQDFHGRGLSGCRHRERRCGRTSACRGWTAEDRRAASASSWSSLPFAPARLTWRPSTSPGHPSRSASVVRSIRLSRMSVSRDRWAGSGRRSEHPTQAALASQSTAAASLTVRTGARKTAEYSPRTPGRGALLPPACQVPTAPATARCEAARLEACSAAGVTQARAMDVLHVNGNIMVRRPERGSSAPTGTRRAGPLELRLPPAPAPVFVVPSEGLHRRP